MLGLKDAEIRQMFSAVREYTKILQDLPKARLSSWVKFLFLKCFNLGQFGKDSREGEF